MTRMSIKNPETSTWVIDVPIMASSDGETSI